jgi:hypothetical protein
MLFEFNGRDHQALRIGKGDDPHHGKRGEHTDPDLRAAIASVGLA